MYRNGHHGLKIEIFEYLHSTSIKNKKNSDGI